MKEKIEGIITSNRLDTFKKIDAITKLIQEYSREETLEFLETIRMNYHGLENTYGLKLESFLNPAELGGENENNG